MEVHLVNDKKVSLQIKSYDRTDEVLEVRKQYNSLQ